MKNFFIFLFLIILLNLAFVSAGLSLSPGKLYFNALPNERVCENVVISSGDYNGSVKLRDIWRGDMENDPNINNYNKLASDLGINIEHVSIIENFDGEETLEVCVTGKNLGDYRGALMFTPGAEGNVVVEVGTWLFVSISNEKKESNNSSSVKSAVSTSEATGNVVKQNETDVVVESSSEKTDGKTFKEEQINSVNEPKIDRGFTGSVIGITKENKVIILITLVVLAAIVGFLIYKKRQRDKWYI